MKTFTSVASGRRGWRAGRADARMVYRPAAPERRESCCIPV